MRNFSISDKLIFLFVIINIIAVGTVGYFSFYNSERTLLKRIEQQLTTLKNVKKRQLENYLKDRRNEILQLISLMNNNKNDNLQQTLIQNKEQIIKSKHITDILTGEEKPKPVWETKTDSLFIYEKIDTINAISKLYYIFKHQKDTIWFELNYDDINKIMIDNISYDQFGESGESYLVGKDFFMRSDSRFIKQSAMSVKVNTEATNSALNNKSGFGIYKDYRNIEVLGSFDIIKENDFIWILIVELDKSEGIKEILLMRNKIILLFILTSIGVIASTFVIARKISSPVKNLTKAAMSLSAGKFEKIEFESKDEIGQLVNSFNNMGQKIIEQEMELVSAYKKNVKASFDATDKERKRLSLELHDNIGQRLIACKYSLENISDDVPASMKNQIDIAKRTIDNTINEIRNLITNLHPSILNEFGLVHAVRLLIDDVKQLSGIEVQLTCNVKIDVFNIDARTYVFRIIQEAISNSIQHSQCDKIEIEMNSMDNAFSLKIKDNGLGFVVSDNVTGNGLINMKERVELLNGQLTINSSENEGTEIFVRIPVDNVNEQ